MDIEDAVLDDLIAITGDTKKSPAVARAVEDFVKRKKAKAFGVALREGAFDYHATNDEIEAQDR